MFSVVRKIGVRFSVLALLALVAGQGWFVPNVGAQSDQERALRAREAGAADLPALQRAVEKKIGGKVVGVTPQGSGKALRYKFRVLRGADLVVVTVNAQSGAITNVKEPR